MNRKSIGAIALLSLFSLLSLSTSCSETASIAEVAQAKAPTTTQASAVAPAQLADLEKRVARLEQGLDERAIEYNMVQSALMYMLVDTKLSSIPGNKSYTSDMRQFPSPAAPLYGFDKNKDGKPDTNYVPFEKTKWFYSLDTYSQFRIIQFPDPKLIEAWSRDVGRGKTEAYETELHNIQTAYMAMLADSKAGVLDAAQTNISDMDLVTTDGGKLRLSSYLTGLNPDGTVKSGCRYDFAKNDTITQHPPAATIPSPTVPSSQKTYETEWHNIQTAVMAMLADSTSGNLTGGTGVPQTNMHNVTSIDKNRTLYLSDYLTGLNGTSVTSGCTYTFTADGTVIQTRP